MIFNFDSCNENCVTNDLNRHIILQRRKMLIFYTKQNGRYKIQTELDASVHVQKKQVKAYQYKKMRGCTKVYLQQASALS
jgi:hypothetical protein